MCQSIVVVLQCRIWKKRFHLVNLLPPQLLSHIITPPLPPSLLPPHNYHQSTNTLWPLSHPPLLPPSTSLHGQANWNRALSLMRIASQVTVCQNSYQIGEQYSSLYICLFDEVLSSHFTVSTYIVDDKNTLGCLYTCIQLWYVLLGCWVTTRRNLGCQLGRFSFCFHPQGF